MWIVLTALRRPYTFVVLAVAIAIFGVRAALFTPTDILPNTNIPVVSVVWTYNGLLPNDMSGRVVYFYERYFRKITFYRIDRMCMYQQAVNAAVMQVIDEISKQQCIRPLSEFDRGPVLRELFHRQGSNGRL